MERLSGHAALQELLGAYALDAVEPDEAAAVERHLPTCPRCRSEVAEHREVAALLGYAGGAAPSGVWDRIIASLEEPPPALTLTRALGPVNAPPPPATTTTTTAPLAAGDVPPAQLAGATTPPPAGAREFAALADDWGPKTPPSIHARALQGAEPDDAAIVPIGRGRRHRSVPMRFMVAVATAAAVIVAALGVEVGRLQVHDNRPASVSALAALAWQVAEADPKGRHLVMNSPDGIYTVKAVILPSGVTYLGPGNLETLPAGETYQMWGIVDGARVSLGVIGGNPTYASFNTPPVASVLAMTVEPRGGVVTSTKTPVVAAVVTVA